MHTQTSTLNVKLTFIVGIPPPFLQAGGGGLSLQPNFQKGGLTGPQFLEGVAGKEGVTFFRGVAIFT